MKKNPGKKRSPYILVLKGILIILTVIFSAAIVPLAGAGLIYNGSSYGAAMKFTGMGFIVSGAAMSIAAVLIIFRKNTAGTILEALGFIGSMIMLYIVMDHADISGWRDNYTMEPVSDMYFRRIFPTIIQCILAIGIALYQRFTDKDKNESELSSPTIL